MYLLFALVLVTTSHSLALAEAPWPQWPHDFQWNSAGRVPGKECTQVVEIIDPHTWTDNYFCWTQGGRRNPQMKWSSAGPISGMRCTQIHEAADPHSWQDNYLCVPHDSPYNFRWSSAGPIAGLQCINWHEAADPNTWADNYLCDDPRYSGLSTLMKTALRGLRPPAEAAIVDAQWNAAEKKCISDGTCAAKYGDFALAAQVVGNGMTAAQQVFEVLSQIAEISKATNIKSLGKMAGPVGAAFGAFAAIVEIVALFGGSELQKLDTVIELLNDGFSRMEYRFDELGGRIDDLDKAMKEQFFWTRVQPKLEKLNSVKQRIKDYFKVSKPEVRALRASMLDKSQWQDQYDAFNALRAGFDGDKSTGSFCKELTVFTNTDRRKIVNILVNLYSRMVKGAMDLLLIGSILGHKEDIPLREKEYEEVLVRIANTIKDCDSAIETTKWLETWKGDLTRTIGDTAAGHESALADRIYNTLSNKYYWRHWLVVVYKEMHLEEKHWRTIWGVGSTSVNKLHWKGRYNVIVSSVPADAPSRKWSGPITSQRAERYRRWEGRPRKVKWYTRYIPLDAKEIQQAIPQSAKTGVYPIVGVIEYIPQIDDGKFQVRAPENRKFHKLVSSGKQVRCTGAKIHKRCKTQHFNVIVLG